MIGELYENERKDVVMGDAVHLLAKLDSLHWFSQRHRWMPHFWGCAHRGLWPQIWTLRRFLYNAPNLPKFHHPMFTRSEVIVLTNKQTDAAQNIQRSSLRYANLSMPERSANPAQHHRRLIISCDCCTCMEESSYQHHSINLFAIFQETT